MHKSNDLPGFDSLALPSPILQAVKELGYETASPIQSSTIPHLLQGQDLIGQAQTGTGKTAAFTLPLLANLKLGQKEPQILVLTPTRELAIQVAEAMHSYARHLKGFRIAPIYGGQSYPAQIKQLKNGVHVVVGTPGRVMDHMRRGTLKLDALSALVLDEADEMLRMGFVEDVEWVLEKSPQGRQIALFSATMPKEIRRIAKKYLSEAVEVSIKQQTATATTINQRYWSVRGTSKLDALTRILEVESYDAVLCFVRTKTATVELTQKLNARGLAATALNGDIDQRQREQTLDQLRRGKIDILVATDVAARGLDVDRVSHVINYDIPYDTESYVHRIGRTGRAGRTGEAILFVAPREQRMFRTIERACNQRIPEMQLPTNSELSKKRFLEFREKVSEALSKPGLVDYIPLVETLQSELEVESGQLLAALLQMAQRDMPLIPKKERARKEKPLRASSRDANARPTKRHTRGKKAKDVVFKPYRLEVGSMQGAKVGNIVGAIANEAGLDAQYIGSIDICEKHTEIDLPADLPQEVLDVISQSWVAGTQLAISAIQGQRKNRSKDKRKTSEGNSRGSRGRKRGVRRNLGRSGNASGDRRKKPHRKANKNGKKTGPARKKEVNK